MATEPNDNEQDWYDDYVINSLSDLFRFIELRLDEIKQAPSIKGAVSKEIRLKDVYGEALGYAIELRKADPKLIEPPPPTTDNIKNLINLRDWCTDSRRQDYISESPVSNISEAMEDISPKKPGRPKHPKQLVDKVFELKNSGKYSWKEIAEQTGLTDKAVEGIHYRYTKNTTKPTKTNDASKKCTNPQKK